MEGAAQASFVLKNRRAAVKLQAKNFVEACSGPGKHYRQRVRISGLPYAAVPG